MNAAKYKWKSVNFNDFGTGAANTNFDGLLGIEECVDYGVLSKRKARRKALKDKSAIKRKATDQPEVEAKPKNSKLNNSINDFEVENINANISFSPSKGNSTGNVNVKLNKKDRKNKAKVNKDKKNVDDKSVQKKTLSENKTNADTAKGRKKQKKPKGKKGGKKKHGKGSDSKEMEKNEDEEVEICINAIPVEDLQAWEQFSIPDVILKALADQGFSNPTAIQELTLPAALHGRRDILGAAETGSGKTLAFGIPILAGILRLKEDASNGIQDKTLEPIVHNLTNPLGTEQAKIVNYNKLSKDEKKALIKDIKRKNKTKKPKFFSKSSDGESDIDDDESDIEDDESDIEDDESDIEVDEDNNRGGDSETDLGSDDNLSDNDISYDDMPDDDSESNISESADEDIGSDIDEESGDEGSDFKVENGEESDGDKKSADDESDFEEKEEEVEGVNEKGIGCVKVIDNITPPDAPVLGRVEKKGLKPLYALILTPTRELAIQIRNHLVAAAKYTDIQIAVVMGGMAEVKQERVLRRGPEIVVATPGRLWQLIQQGNAHLSQVADIRYLAIDETDRMLERGHFEELHQLLDQINYDESRRSRRQTFVFSATLTMVHDLPHHLKGKKVTKKGKVLNRKVTKLTTEQKLKKVIEMLGITDPKVVDVTDQNQGASNTLTECRIMCPIDHKDFYLYYVLKRYPGRTIVFCNSIGCVKRLAQLFGMLQCAPLPLHANMQQRQRLKNLDKFRDSPHGLLIATDVAARGLDIPNVEHVIHYQVPRTAENYVHRSGRTARASKEGITILMMEPTEVQNYHKMCRTLSKTEDLAHFPVDGALLSSVRGRVERARELDALTLRLRKDSAQRGWLDKAAQDMDIIIDSSDVSHRMENEVASDLKNTLVIKRKQLNSLLASPLFPKGFSFKFPTNNMFDSTLAAPQAQNAVQAMKSAMDSGLVKKLKNATKNEAILKLECSEPNSVSSITSNDQLKEKSAASKENGIGNGEKLSKNKWKKFKRNKA